MLIIGANINVFRLNVYTWYIIPNSAINKPLRRFVSTKKVDNDGSDPPQHIRSCQAVAESSACAERSYVRS